MLIHHLHLLFDELSAQIFCHILNWVVGFHAIELMSSLYIVDTSTLSDTYFENILFPILCVFNMSENRRFYF